MSLSAPCSSGPARRGNAVLGLPAEPAEPALQLIGFDRDMALRDLACEHCGAEVVQAATGRVPMFCGERCRKDSSLARAADRTLAA